MQTLETCRRNLQNKPEEPADKPEELCGIFEKVEEYQVMILGLDRCTLQVPGSSVRFHSNMIILSAPKFWWFGLNRSSDYPEVSESQTTMMDTIMDTVQLAIDIVGLFPCCNVICGALNAGISLARGDYYGAVCGLMGMLSPGIALAGRVVKGVSKSVDTAEAVVKVLKVLKAGASGLKAAVLSGDDFQELLRRCLEGNFSITDQEDLALLNSLGGHLVTALGSAKDVYDTTKSPKKPQGDENAVKKDSGDETGPVKRSRSRKPHRKAAGRNRKMNIPVMTDRCCYRKPEDCTDRLCGKGYNRILPAGPHLSVHLPESGEDFLRPAWLFNVGSWLTVDGDQAVVILPDMHLEHFLKTEQGWENERGGGRVRKAGRKAGRNIPPVGCIRRKNRHTYMAKMEDSSRSLTETGTAPGRMRYTGTTLQEIRFAGGQCLHFGYEDGKISEIKDVIGKNAPLPV